MKKILSILVCVCVLLSAMVFTASAETTEIVFDFGENKEATTHADGNDIGTSKSYTSGNYTLELTNAYKCYDGANDATGVSALKMGTSSVVGNFTITVPNDVTSVIFMVAKYKAKNTTVDINGTQHTINTSSDEGAYTAITVETTSVKEITFATVSGKTRCMIDSITYVIAGTTGGEETACQHTATSTEPNGDETHKVVCDDCGEPTNAAVDCTDADVDGKCDVCDGNVALPVAKTIAEVLAMADGDTKFYVTAEIVDTYRDTWATYGNFILKDDSTEDTIIMYGLKDENGNRYDAMETKPVVGDTVKVLANRSSYNSVGQLANAVLVELIPGETPENPENPENTDPEADSTLTITEATELGASKESGAYTEGKYYVTGQIVSVTNTQYGNMYIADEDGNEILVYGTYSADGELRYDAMETKPDAGDIVTVYGVVGNYNGTAQLKNAWIIEFTEGELDVETPAEPEADSALTVEEAIELGLTKRSNEFTTNKYYVTATITEVYNEEYGNMRVTDEDGNILTIYGSYDADGTNRYDAMENAPVAGDTVKLYGVIGQYDGTAQMKNAWVIEIVAENTNDDTTVGDNTNTDNSTTSPDTGDNVGAFAVMAIAAAAVVIAASKKRA